MKKITLLAFLSIFLIIGLASPALAADITGERTLNTTNVKAGESFRVTLDVTVSGGTLYSLGIDEDLPDGWTVTPVQNDEMIYDSENTQWDLIGEMSSGKKTIIYDVFVPITTKTGTYSIAGEVSAKELTDEDEIERQNNITGGTNVTVEIMKSGGLANSAWPKFQRDLNNSGQSPYNGPQTNNSIWTYTATKQIIGSPAIGEDGTIYIGSYDNNLYALNPDGSLKWSYTTGNRISSSPAIGVDGTVYIGSYDKNIYALNPDGTLKWSYTTGRISSSPSIGTDGTVYIGSDDKYLYGLNPDGTLKWKYYAGAQLQCTPAIGTDGTIYIESGYSNVYALNPDGTLKWNYNKGQGLTGGSPVIGADGTIYIGNSDNKKIYALNPDGTLKWSYTAGGGLGSFLPVIGADGTIYIGSADDNLYALNPDGTLKWTYAIGNQIGSPIVGADGTIYIGSSDKNLYALNPNGTLKWTYATGNKIYGSPAIAVDGTLYIGSSDNKLYAFRDTDVLAANFTAIPTAGEAPLIVNFTDLSTNSPISWAWDFDNDGVVDSTDQNPTYTYTVTGNYTVNLTVTNSVGSNSTAKTDYINVSESFPIESTPVAVFTADVTSGTAPLQVNFTDQSTGSPTSWLWDFGDGFNDTEQNVSHIYESAGNYTVNLVVSNENGTNSTSALITVSEKPVTVLPMANFSTNVSEGYAPLSVQFTDLSENATDWNWNFGDGTNSTEQNPIHTYTSVGSYTVNLTVSNAAGSDSEVKTGYIKVTVPSPGKPVAAFSASTASVKAPLTVAFTDKSSNLPTKWKWSFGDGTSSTQQNPKHKYSKAGKYTVTLTVTNAKGSNTVTETDYIKVISKPVSNFTSSVTSGKAPLNVKFTDTSTGTASSWIWDFGDGSKSFVENPTHKFSKAGTYTVNLTVKNAAGSNTVTKTEYIKIITKPVANFTSSVTSGKAPLNVKFTDTSTGTASGWIWEFGDGSKSFVENPTHKYSKAGTYTVSLTVKNASGSNTVTKTDYIKVVTKTVA